MAQGTVTVRVLGDARGLTRELDDASDRLKKFGDRMSMTVTPALTALAATSVSAAADVEESVNKVGVVFGNASEEVLAFGENSATAIGQSRREALEAAASFGNMLNTIGLAESESARMSVTMTQLASDMASLNNEDPSDMLIRLRSGLAGEAEPLRRFGVLLSAAAVEAHAVEQGIAAAGEELTEGQKVMARYSLILEQTQTAHGDFARTSEGLANQQRILKAEWEDVRAEIGENLLPVVMDLVSGVGVLLDSFGNMPEGVQNAVLGFGAVLAAAGPVLSTVTRLKGAFAALMTGMGPAGLAIAGLATALGVLASNHIEARQRVADYTEAIRADTGAIGENTRATATNALQKADLRDSLALLGLSTTTVVEAMLGEEDALGKVDEALNAAFDATERGISAQGEYMGAAQDVSRFLGQQKDAIAEAEDAQREFEAIQADSTETARIYQDLLDDGIPVHQAWAAAQGLAAQAADEAAGSADGAADSVGEFGDEMGDAADDASKLKDKLDILSGAQLEVDQAAIRYQQTLADVREELGEGSRTLDVNTEAGRENRQAVIDLIEESFALIGAMEEEGATTYELSSALQNHVLDLRGVMEQAGFTEEQIQDLIDRYNLTPEEVQTAVHATNVEETIADLGRLDRAISGVGTSLQSVSADLGLHVSTGPYQGGRLEGTGDGPGMPVSMSVSHGGGIGDGPGIGAAASTPQSMVDVEAFLKNFATVDMPALGMLGPAAGWQAMMEALRAIFPGMPLHSGYRPGAITATGRPSYHGKGRAVDIPPDMAIFNAIANSPVAAITRELIFSPAGNRQIHNGRPHYYSGVTRDNHWDHIHWALANGGFVPSQPGGVPARVGEGVHDEIVLPMAGPVLTDVGQAIAQAILNAASAVGTPAEAAGNFGRLPSPEAIANRETLRIEALSPEERLAEVNAEMAQLTPYTDEWMRLLREGQGLTDEIAQAHARARQEAEALAETEARALETLRAERDRTNEELGRALTERGRLQAQLNDAEEQHLLRVAELEKQRAAQIQAAIDLRMQELVAFTPNRGGTSSIDDRFVLADVFDPDSANYALGTGATTNSGGASLIDQLTGSNGDLQEMIDLLARLRGDGLDEEVIALLGLDAPQQLDLLREVAGYTAAEVEQLNQLVVDRYRLAGSQVKVEQDNLLGTLGASLTSITEQTAAALAALEESWAATSAQMATSIDAMTAQIDELIAAISRMNAAIASAGGSTAPTVHDLADIAQPGGGIVLAGGNGNTGLRANVTVNVDGKEVASQSESWLGTRDFGTRLMART